MARTNCTAQLTLTVNPIWASVTPNASIKTETYGAYKFTDMAFKGSGYTQPGVLPLILDTC